MTTATATAQPERSKALHITLWVFQGLLGALFLFAGAKKTFQPMEELAAQMPWTAVVGVAMTRFIGISELLGGLGLILPSALRIKPILTVLAAAGLAVIMVLATLFHISRGEMGILPMNFVLMGLSAFIAWGRFKKAPIAGR